MLGVCFVDVDSMLALCWAYVAPMLDLYWAHGEACWAMLGLCRAHVMLGLCWAHFQHVESM